MSETVSAIAKAIVAIPDLMKEIYTDLAKPGVRQAGKALDGVMGLGNTALYPVHLLNAKASEKLKANLEQYRQKLEHVPEEEIIPVAPEIGVPIAEKLAYVSNEDLANMYTTLLAKASSSINVDQVHPGFVDVINRICPDEAILLQKFKKYNAIPFIEIRFTRKDGTWRVLKDLALDPTFYEGLQQAKDVPAYLSNFDAIGIIDICRTVFCSPRDSNYIPIVQFHKPYFDILYKSTLVDEEITSIDGKLQITPFGKLFIKACFTPLTRNEKSS